MPHLSQFTLLDYSNEKSSVTLYNGAITAVSLPGFLTDFNNLRGAIDAITLGTVHQESWIGDRTLVSSVLPTDPHAQREIKWLVTYTDDVTSKKYSITIPTADPKDAAGTGSRLLPGTDVADLADPEIAAFVTQFQTIARSPENDTHNVTVVSIRLVGRNI